jgi:hypothetical protein
MVFRRKRQPLEHPILAHEQFGAQLPPMPEPPIPPRNPYSPELDAHREASHQMIDKQHIDILNGLVEKNSKWNDHPVIQAEFIRSGHGVLLDQTARLVTGSAKLDVESSFYQNSMDVFHFRKTLPEAVADMDSVRERVLRKHRETGAEIGT